MANQTLTNIPPPRVPIVDPRTGLMSRDWYRWFLNLFTLTGSGSNSASITDLQQGPVGATVADIYAALESLPALPEMSNAELEARINALGNAALTIPVPPELETRLLAIAQELETLPQFATKDHVAELAKAVDGLAQNPPRDQYVQRRYGNFYDTTTQTAAVINTAYAVTFNTTSYSNGVYVGSPASRIYVDRPGIYNFQISLQTTQTGAATSHIWYWGRVNGVDLTYSASVITLAGAGRANHVSDQALIKLNAGDYIEVMWSTDDTNCQLAATAAAAPVPGIPSAILVAFDNIDGVTP